MTPDRIAGIRARAIARGDDPDAMVAAVEILESEAYVDLFVVQEDGTITAHGASRPASPPGQD
jgi:hypothetical protein